MTFSEWLAIHVADAASVRSAPICIRLRWCCKTLPKQALRGRRLADRCGILVSCVC